MAIFGRIIPVLLFNAALALGSQLQAQPSGSSFEDCEACPTMVVIPAGSYQMGDLSGTGLPAELPVHPVTITRAFAVGRTEITFTQWDACIADNGCTHVPSDGNWGRGNRAVGNVSWEDAAQYVEWLSRKSGKQYRLLTESEWEYATRAGTSTVYPWGNELGTGNAICLSCGVESAMNSEVAQVSANDFGIFDMIGSVKEWVQDCYSTSYEGSPDDGSAWIDGDCDRRVVRGGAWYDSARYIRSASRAGAVAKSREEIIGFRVARDVEQ